MLDGIGSPINGNSPSLVHPHQTLTIESFQDRGQLGTEEEYVNSGKGRDEVQVICERGLDLILWQVVDDIASDIHSIT